MNIQYDWISVNKELPDTHREVAVVLDYNTEQCYGATYDPIINKWAVCLDIKGTVVEWTDCPTITRHNL